MKRPALDLSLYLVAGTVDCGGRSLEWVVREAVRGGVTVVQLREKTATTRRFVELAERVRDLLRPLGVPVIVNDRLDVALAVDAEGAHVGQSDMPPERARAILGVDRALGLSVGTPEQAEAAAERDVDYLGVGPIFATATKTDTSPEWGCEGLARLRPRTHHRLVAIGGVGVGNAAEVIRAGADGIAVVSAICAAADPARAAAELRDAIEKARGNPS